MLQIKDNMVRVSECDSSENSFKSTTQNLEKEFHSNVELSTIDTGHEHGDSLAKDDEQKTIENSVLCRCSCHLTSKRCLYDNSSMENAKFRDLLLLHLDLIEQQNINIQKKDHIIQQMKTENDQLNARLNRMERRISLKIRKNTDDINVDSSKTKTYEYKRKKLLEKCDEMRKLKRPPNHMSAVTISSEQGKESGTGVYLKTDFNYLHSKNYSSFEIYDIENTSKIQVPFWKNASITVTQGGDCKKSHCENPDTNEETDDETYLRRHSKMEIDEIRRKRWDIQQLRQERMQDSLKQRQKNREDMKNARLTSDSNIKHFDSLNPSSDRVMALEISDSVPVFAFGSRIAQLQQTEFDLPWFDVAKREIQNRQKNVKKQRKRTWYKY